jgi:transcriptional regulator with XRE-family HTH domain
MGSRPARQRYCRCGAHLAADNTEGQCAHCQRASRDKYIAPPQVPPEFWRTEPLRMAFAAQHMGHVSRAYRVHPHHQTVYGPGGIPQGLLGQWLGLQQPQVSRIETGPPIRDLDTLAYWARVLRIPAGMLWFDLPGETRQPASQSLDGSNSDYDANKNLHTALGQPSLEALFGAPLDETIAYLKEQWHVLVRADNLFGPAHTLRLVHEQSSS